MNEPTSLRSTWLASLAALSLLGCTGEVLGGGTGGSSSNPIGSGTSGTAGAPPTQVDPTCSERQLFPRRLRALSATQYARTLATYFSGTESLTNPFDASDRSATFSTSSGLRRFDFNATLILLENGKKLGPEGATQLSSEHPCLAADADAPCVAQVVALVGRKLYRRPITGTESEKLAAFFQEQLTLSGDANVAADYLLRAMLASPRFLFRSELGAPTATTGEFALTPHEVATAISYTLTDAPPDAGLAAAADANLLSTPEQIRTESSRVLASMPGMTGVLAFNDELFLTRDFPTVKKDTTLFPLFDDATRADAYADYQAMVASVLRSPTPTLSTLLTTRDFIARPRTAALAGWESATGFAAEGSPFTTTEPGRIGILSHPVMMARFAHADETNPVARGHLISSKLLCASVPPPPMAVMFPERLEDGVPRTLRQILEQQHAVGTCAGCHTLMDPMGYPFEVFDAVGRYRTEELGLPLDTTGVVAGGSDVDGPVANAEEMVNRLASSSAVHDCVAGSAMEYVTGVDDPATYPCVQTAFAKAFRDQAGNIPELFLQVLESEPFLKRAEEM